MFKIIDPATIRASAARGDEHYPHAAWMPLPENATQAKIHATQFLFHTEAGPALTSLDSLWKYLNRNDIVIEPHFILDMDGRMAQCVSVGVRADNNAQANARAISIETQDFGSPSLATTPWTAEQVEQLAGLLAWCHLNPRCSIPLVQAPRWDQPGYGPHSLFKEWSVYVGKTCPGALRTSQIPHIAALAAEIASPTAPKPTPTPTEETDMQMRTVIVNIEGRYAEFWTQTYLNEQGEPHILDVFWSQPGDQAYEDMKSAHAGDGTLIRRTFAPFVAKLWFLNGDAEKITDPTHQWSNVPNVDFRGTAFS